MNDGKSEKNLSQPSTIFDQIKQPPTRSKGKYGDTLPGGSKGGDEGSASRKVLG